MKRKITECHARHALFSNTVNLMEPNVKESPGGLRDYHTARWVAEGFYRAGSLLDLENEGLITQEDQGAVETALDFLFRVRNALHYQYGRKNDLLSVGVQEAVAAALHFEAGGEKLAVEYFLNTYYVHANVIAHYCETIVEAVSRMYRPRRWSVLRHRRRGRRRFRCPGRLSGPRIRRPCKTVHLPTVPVDADFCQIAGTPGAA